MRRDQVYGQAIVALPTAEEARAIDLAAIDQGGIPERLLMENAGRAAALILDRLYPRGRVIAALGGGNNGGDGLVLLRNLRAWGRDVAYLAAGARPPDRALAHEFEIPALEGEPEVALSTADILVDGLLGTGTSGAPRGEIARAVEALNASGRPIVALDLPTGIDATSGAIPGEAVRAELTITFGWPKLGLLFHPARRFAGRLITVEIGFPPIETGASAAVITPGWARHRLPARPPTAHKGTSGRLLILAGREGMAGAALIAAEAAHRAGAGYLWLASEGVNRTALQTALPEAIFIDRSDEDELLEVAARGDALLIGPGIGVDDVALSLLRTLLIASPGRPTLLDADALTLLARGGDELRDAVGDRGLVITPHPGEMSRLTGRPVEEIVHDPIGAAVALATDLGGVVLLKGMPSVIAAPGEVTLVNSVGSSDLARAGMGDQLAGVIGALLAAGLEPRDAAALGLYYTGRTADLLGRGRTLGPRDLSEHLSLAFDDVEPDSPPLGLPFITFDQPARW